MVLAAVQWQHLALIERVCDTGLSGARETGGSVADVRLQEARLDEGVHVMYRDFGRYVRAAYDPHQINRAQALALLCTRLPQIVGSLHLTAA